MSVTVFIYKSNRGKHGSIVVVLGCVGVECMGLSMEEEEGTESVEDKIQGLEVVVRLQLLVYLMTEKEPNQLVLNTRNWLLFHQPKLRQYTFLAGVRPKH